MDNNTTEIESEHIDINETSSPQESIINKELEQIKDSNLIKQEQNN